MENAEIRVLLVEDNPGDVRLIREMLIEAQAVHFRVFTADNLDDGLRLLREKPVDVILLDLSLPDSFGIDTLHQVYAHVQHIPVVVLTGFRDESLGMQSMQLGAQDYLIKDSVDSNLLVRSLRYAIERHRVEQKLRKSDEEYRSLINDVFNNSMVGVLILDADLRVVWVNDTAEKYLDMRRRDMIGQYKPDLIEQRIKYIFEDPDGFAQKVVKTYRHNTFAERFEVHVLPDENRRERWLEHWSQPIHSGMYAGGRIEQYTDITNRKLIEIAEHEQRMFAEALKDTAAALTSTLNLDEVLDRVLASIGSVVPHDMANIMLLKEGELVVARSQIYTLQEEDVTAIRTRLFIEESPILARMIDTKRRTVMREVQPGEHRLLMIAEPRIRAYLGIPILLKHEVIGFINLFSLSPNFFTHAHADRLEAFAEQAATGIQNARLYQQSQELAALEERNRLARELHDSVSQTLFTANVIAESALRQWSINPTKTQQLLEQVHKLTTSAVAEMRILLLELRPKALEQIGLDGLIQQLSQSLQSRRQFELNLEIDALPPLPLEVKMVYYRITQESLNNIIKHAQATRVTVSIGIIDGNMLLRIEDDGRGFDSDSVRASSFGLNIMRERAESVSATLNIYSEVDRGTQITVSWQLQSIQKVG